ncbi:hypothetical protein DN730_17395 [Marinomonas piezotolerans]|uniref:JmjC domain-containing protein n=1 Tax=Marinomonas piezotolerans TaxID=2213058 RepID=A0A370U4X6_9GAMM|nr:cupin-like domain-containing protein [Marinomonas piezotolerans]RDL42836.1 hypothetical protein DN730_17395 [Marinomonas piezotolerans]
MNMHKEACLAEERVVNVNPVMQPKLREFAQTLIDGFENPEQLSGSCKFEFEDEGNTHTLFVQFNSSGLFLSEEVEGGYEAQVNMPLSVAERIVEDVEAVDYRDPDIIGHMDMTGNLNIVNHIAKALVKPSAMTQHTFQDATENYREAYAADGILYLDRPSEMEILEAIEKKQPFVIRNAPVDVPHSEWSLTKLKEKYGDVLLRVKSATQQETVAEFVDQLLSNDQQDAAEIIEGHTKVYTEGCSLPWQMIEDFLPQYFTTHDYTPPQIWLGSVPVNVPASSLHRDPLDGFLYQIMGRKKVILYSPDQAASLYPMKAYNNYQPCWVKPEVPNYEHFPMFKQAKRLEAILHPGEILVQPAGWFHAVYCLDSPTFSVSYFLNFPVGVHNQAAN